ncbi:MAG: GntR family transcriptional regulator [Acidobacteriota bacterium]
MKKPKHFHIYQELHNAIVGGRYEIGHRLPSEAQLVEQFSTSRPTVARALRELQYQGLIERRAGSGSYVRKITSVRTDLFGLLIPGLGETEIFEPICREMSRFSEESRHALLWGDTTSESLAIEEQAKQLCQLQIARKVSGVFFAPLEFSPNKNQVNQQITNDLQKAHIPVVLLDRCIYEHPRRSPFDLVGIDNCRAGFVITEHLLKLGCKRIGFLAREGSAPTVDARIAGYHIALLQHGVTPRKNMVWWGDPADENFVKGIINKHDLEAFVCANDDTAAHLMHTLDKLGARIPQDYRIVGFDDVKYAKLLKVPLTTIHQPCKRIGEVAVKTMVDRIEYPNLPTRDVLLDFHLVVRESCGVNLKKKK